MLPQPLPVQPQHLLPVHRADRDTRDEMSAKQLGMTNDGRFSLQQYVRLVEVKFPSDGKSND